VLFRVAVSGKTGRHSSAMQAVRNILDSTLIHYIIR